MQKKALEMEMEHKNKIHALELENLIEQNRHNAVMREKELLLIEMKIKKTTE